MRLSIAETRFLVLRGRSCARTIGSIEMKKHYDFSQAKRNPYAKRLKQQLTIRLDTDTVAYFRTLAKEMAIPYQTLMNLYLRDCAQARRRLRVACPAQRASRAKAAAIG